MHGVTILWSMCAATCLVTAGVHLLAWARHRVALSNLAFALVSACVAGVAVAEYLLMQAATPEAYEAILRWANFPILGVFVAICWLMHLELGTSRWGWAGIAVGLRALVLVLGYFPGPTPAFREITGLVELRWLGERIAVVGEATPTPWNWLPAASSVALAIFVADAATRLWRRGGREDRIRAWRLGVPLIAFILISTFVALAIHTGVAQVPFVTSVSYLAVVVMLGYELTGEVLRAHLLVDKLRQSERRLHLAGEAAGIGLWFYNIERGSIWATDQAKSLFGFRPEPEVTFAMFMDRVHPEDRPVVDTRIAAAVHGDGRYSADYRVVLPDGAIRWVSARGEVTHDPDGSAGSMIGVVFDITERRRAELELTDQRTQLAHLARVTTVTELSGSLAHEINQPLAIILTNAQAAQRLIAKDPPDLAEAREILADIGHEAQRAGEVIRRLRGLLRNEQVTLRPVALAELVHEVLLLLRRDLDSHGVDVRIDVPGGLPQVMGDAVQLQQVLLNLILNACEAMQSCPAGQRVLTLSALSVNSHVRVSVLDTGRGPALDVERIFEPFYTTKRDGLGLGLPICRSIVAAHRGRLWAEVRPPTNGGGVHGGSAFHFELGAVPSE